jgi:hypothetical protein
VGRLYRIARNLQSINVFVVLIEGTGAEGFGDSQCRRPDLRNLRQASSGMAGTLEAIS